MVYPEAWHQGILITASFLNMLSVLPTGPHLSLASSHLSIWKTSLSLALIAGVCCNLPASPPFTEFHWPWETLVPAVCQTIMCCY